MLYFKLDKVSNFVRNLYNIYFATKRFNNLAMNFNNKSLPHKILFVCSKLSSFGYLSLKSPYFLNIFQILSENVTILLYNNFLKIIWLWFLMTTFSLTIFLTFAWNFYHLVWISFKSPNFLKSFSKFFKGFNIKIFH